MAGAGNPADYFKIGPIGPATMATADRKSEVWQPSPNA